MITAMTGGQVGAAPVDAGQPLGRAWRPYRGAYDGRGRLNWSTRIVLIAVPIGLLLFSVIRVLIVADYNLATASAIASSGGYVDTLLGAIIPLVPIFTPYLGLLLLFFGRVVAGILMLLAAAFMSPLALARPVALHLPSHDWYAATHRGPLILLVMFVLAFSQHLGSIAVALFRFSLRDLRDYLILNNVIPDAHIDRTQPAADGGDHVDDSASFADQNALTGDSGRNPSDHAPYCNCA